MGYFVVGVSSAESRTAGLPVMYKAQDAAGSRDLNQCHGVYPFQKRSYLHASMVWGGRLII